LLQEDHEPFNACKSCNPNKSEDEPLLTNNTCDKSSSETNKKEFDTNKACGFYPCNGDGFVSETFGTSRQIQRRKKNPAHE
jgi:hypothetical protein